MVYFNLNDSVNLIKKLTLRRLWNATLVMASFQWSKLLKKPVQWGYPISISFEPTTSCNLRCPECPSGLREFTRPTGMLQKDFFRETIDDIYKELLYLIFYFQGEPYLNPDFLEMVKYASDKGIYTATSTNAHYLTDEKAKKTVESGLDRLIISIDGTTQDVYQQYRVGGKLDKVLEGARNIVKWKKELNSKTPFIFFQFLVVKPNEHQIEEVKKLGAEIGVDQVRFKTAQVYDFQNDPNQLIPTIEKYSRYKIDKNGEVIGVLSTREKQAEGVAFAIKSKNIFKLIDEVKDSDTSVQKIKIVSHSSIKGMDRSNQIKQMENCVFLVQAFNKK